MLCNHQGEAEGDLYIDDGHSFAYKNGAFAYMKFSFKRGKLTALYVQYLTYCKLAGFKVFKLQL